MPIEDNYFACGEVPLQFPTTFDVNQISKSYSDTLRLTADIAGPGNVTAHPLGLTINENPTVTLSLNGIQHSLTETILTFPSGHRLGHRQDVCPAELFIFFQNTQNFTDQICLCVLLDIGGGESNSYFSTLSTSVTDKRPKISSVIPKDTQIFNYPGADIRSRTKDNPIPRSYCDPVKQILKYYLCLTPARISGNDYDRLMAISRKTLVGPPKPKANALDSRVRTLGTLIDSIIITTPASVAKDGGVSLNAMKCYRLDQQKDIVGDKVYVGDQKRPDTLANEISKTNAEIDSQDGISDVSIRPGDIEKWLGITLGVILGVIICATVAYYVWKYTFKNYLHAQKLYNNPVSAASLSVKLPSIPPICPPATK